MVQVEVAKCDDRGCKYFSGFRKLKSGVIVNYCKAFPDGIPEAIAYGDNKHLKPLKGQKNDIVFEKEAD